MLIENSNTIKIINKEPQLKPTNKSQATINQHSNKLVNTKQQTKTNNQLHNNHNQTPTNNHHNPKANTTNNKTKQAIKPQQNHLTNQTIARQIRETFSTYNSKLSKQNTKSQVKTHKPPSKYHNQTNRKSPKQTQQHPT